MKVEDDLLSVALNPSDLIQYAKGSVVSRQIIKGDAGTITLFAFDEGQSLSEHTSPYIAFVQIIDGKGECVIGGKHVEVCKDESIVLPANIPHSVNAVERFKMLLVMIKG